MYPDPETQRPEGDPLHQEHEAVGHQAQQDCADLRPAVPVCSLLGPDLWRRPAGQWPEGGQPEAEDPSGGVCPCLPRSSSCWKALSWGRMARSCLTPSSCTHQRPGQAQARPPGPAAPPSAGVQMQPCPAQGGAGRLGTFRMTGLLAKQYCGETVLTVV